ncbi:flavin-dependent oxidoreductase [Actinoplanes sp. NPDC089786]|uniref:flavin-dependent oxidoreductase n=1 Tax=Actinoplanes sp. NPDC089786 TaxID=3155185 RepID=UPI0034252A88
MKVLVIGGGVGGLATALSLHAAGVDCEVYEQSREMHELGVGINMLPHAVKELAELGLLERLDAAGVRTQELIYTNQLGQEIWREPRGLDAGHEYPQLSIHRGRLHGVLHEATRERIGPERIHTSSRLVGFEQDDTGVTAVLADRRVTGDVLVAADGIHSVVRAALYPDEGPPTWNGMMMWRGAVPYPRLLTGRSMIIAGGIDRAKLVVYPISHEHGIETPLLNWAVGVKLGDGSDPPPRREDWNRPGDIDEVLPHVRREFKLSMVDIEAVIRAGGRCGEFPMCDRDPVPRWSFGRVTLLGDAAHPMYPVGSNGASQAILDARCLAPLLAGSSDPVEALQRYEAERLPPTAEIVRLNRQGGPEGVIDMVSQRAPDGFTNLDEVATREEIEAIIKGYAATAGFSTGNTPAARDGKSRT